MLTNGELPRNRNDILVDVQGRPHKMMLAHHRIKAYSQVRFLASSGRVIGAGGSSTAYFGACRRGSSGSGARVASAGGDD